MKTISKILFLSLLFIWANASAQLYKGVDAEGNVVYSDRPFEKAEKYSAPPISVVSGQALKEEAAPPLKEAAKEEQKPFKYTSFSISSPSRGQTLWNDPDVKVVLNLKPALNTAENHTLWIFLDGKPVIKKSSALTHQLGRLERGAHTIQALLKDGKGNLVASSKTVVVYIKHGSVP